MGDTMPNQMECGLLYRGGAERYFTQNVLLFSLLAISELEDEVTYMGI